MDYKPYSIEWSRKRYLAECIQKYFDDGVSTDNIVSDILDILGDKFAYHQNNVEKVQTIIDKLSH